MMWTRTIQSHVLGEGLRQQHLLAIVNEVPQGERVHVYVSAGKALICHVEVGQKVPLFDEAAQFLPLLRLSREMESWEKGTKMHGSYILSFCMKK